MASSSSSRSSSARARESGSGGRLPWFLLDRAPRLVAQGEMPSDAAVVLRLTRPPALSTVEVSRALLAADASDTEPCHCRVEGADAAGRLLLRFPSRPASTGEGEGDSDSSSLGLAVCVPVLTTRDADVATARTVFLLPDFPVQSLGVAISPAGILAHQGANDATSSYYVVTLQRSLPSSSFAASAFCYSSEDVGWTVMEVVASDERWARFDADSVVSHNRRGDRGGCLVFVDRERGLLLFDPILPASSRFVDFPQVPEREEVERSYFHSSDGALVCVVFYNAGTMVRMWRLEEENNHPSWRLEFPLRDHQMGSDELFKCDMALPYPVAGIAVTVHPHRLTRLFLSVVGHRPSTARNFSVEVDPAGEAFNRVCLVEIHPSSASVTPDILVCRVQTSINGRGWIWRLLGLTASSLIESRKHLNKLPGAIEVVGDLLSLPLKPLVKAAQTIEALSTAYDMWVSSQSAVSNVARQTQVVQVGTVEEADTVIQKWILSGRLTGMRVQAASGMSRQVRIAIRELFVQNGARSLIPRLPRLDFESDCVFVEPAIDFWDES